MTERFLRRREVEKLTGLPCSIIYAKITDNEFPKPVKLGKRAVAWRESEVAAWQADRIAERDAR